ncbi:MAG: hypothetical protein AAFZ04_15295 [Pseudomonadota bacterium]
MTVVRFPKRTQSIGRFADEADIADTATLVQLIYMSRFDPILDALSKDGWSLTPLELASDCWWAKDIWQLQSEWTPKGATIHLSLLVDPMEEVDGNNVPDTAIWAVGLSTNFPHQRSEAEQISVPIKRRMKEATAEVIAEASRLRTAM